MLQHLDRVLQKPIALISAPAGFGKTTLLTQWLESCPLPNAYLQMDRGDHEINSFMSGVIAALHQIFPNALQKTSDLLHAQVSVPLDIWISTIDGDLELLRGTPFVLALDDYQLVANPEIDLLLTGVLQLSPEALHLVISSRRSPSLSFSKLKGQDKVFEITTADLRFTNTEVLAYFEHSTQLSFDDGSINQLNEKTEGWAVGLTLAAISLRDEAQPEEMIANLDRFDRQISDYLLDQVFNLQPEEIQLFMLKAATINHFCAGLLFEVFGGEKSEAEIQAMLEKIEETQLFLISLDRKRTYYRFHHLFRRMLLARQSMYLSPDLVSLYHQRAAEWLVRQGQTTEALDHLTTIQDWTGAAQIVEGQFCDLLNTDDSQGIMRLLGYLPEDFIATRPGLLLMQAWVAHFSLRLMVIHSLIGKIQIMLDAASNNKDALPEGASLPGFEIISYRTVQLNIWILECVILCLTNRGSQVVERILQVSEALPNNWLFVRGNAMVYLGLSMAMDGKYQLAVEILTKEYESLQRTRTAYGKRILFSLATIHMLQGELELCRQTAEVLVRNAKELNFLLMLGWGYYMLGRVYQEWNQLELATRYYKLVIDIGFNTNLFCSLESIAGYVYVLESLGQHELAQQAFDSLQNLYVEHFSATAQPFMALSAWLKLQAGNLQEARRWANSFGTPIAQQAIVWYHIPHFYKAKIQMELNSLEAEKDIDLFLDEVQELSVRTHNIFTQIRTLALRSIWLEKQGERLAALQALEQAIRLGQPGGFIHSFIEHGASMQGLLQAIAPGLKNEANLNEYVKTLLDAFSVPDTQHALPANLSPIKTLLTERELEVLELLAERLTIHEISTKLFISPSTVQQHTHHIYRKLNVNNKRQAVASARLLGILPQIT